MSCRSEDAGDALIAPPTMTSTMDEDVRCHAGPFSPFRLRASVRGGRADADCAQRLARSPAHQCSGGGGDLLTAVGAAERGSPWDRLERGTRVLGEPVAAG